MTLAIGLRTNTMVLALTLSTPRYQFDPVLLSLIAALLVAVGGLAASGLLSLAVVSPVVHLPAITGAFWALWRAAELLVQEVRR